MDCQAVREQLSRLLASGPREMIAAYLYGSVARGEAGDASDVDVGLLLRHPPPPTLEGLQLDLEAQLERELRHPVQVVVLNRAPVDLVHRVLRDGCLVLERDRSARIAFEVRVRNEYFDLAPLRRLYRRPGPGTTGAW